MKYYGRADKDLSTIAFSENTSEVKDVLASAMGRMGFHNFVFATWRLGAKENKVELLQALGSLEGVMQKYIAEKLANSSPVSANFDRNQILDLGPFYQDPRPRPNARYVPRIIELLKDHGVDNAVVIPLLRQGIATRTFLVLADPAPDSKLSFLQRLSEPLPTLLPLAREFSARMMMETVLAPDQVLTSSEILVLGELARGRRPAQIATITRKSIETIRNQTASARARLGAKTTTQAVAIAVRLGFVKL